MMTGTSILKNMMHTMNKSVFGADTLRGFIACGNSDMRFGVTILRYLFQVFENLSSEVRALRPNLSKQRTQVSSDRT